jgi:Zn-dependent peptidase ImmA (M78 family)
MTDELLRQLLETDPSGWSAVTLETAQGSLIIYNPSHSPDRCESDLMHELAHLLCKHEPSLLVTPPGAPFPFRTFTEEQEDEAKWLGACLQLPRPALLWAAKNGKDNHDIALDFGASTQQVAFRRQITGVDRQLGRARRQA